MPYFLLSFRWIWGGRTVSPTRMQWPSRFPLALQQSSHDHPLHSSGQHFSYGFSLEFTRTRRQSLPRASIAVVPIVAASIKMLGTMPWCGFIPKVRPDPWKGTCCQGAVSNAHHTSPYGESNVLTYPGGRQSSAENLSQHRCGGDALQPPFPGPLHSSPFSCWLE
jgi:hypothetical protein